MSAPRLLLYCDGACLPRNPGGWTTWAWVALAPDGRELACASGCLGHGPGFTNNRGEYQAVLEALRWAVGHGGGPVLVRTDSQLVVNQVNGAWQVKSASLWSLVQEARCLLAELGGQIEWIPREANTRADALTYQAYREVLRAHGAPHAGGTER